MNKMKYDIDGDIHWGITWVYSAREHGPSNIRTDGSTYFSTDTQNKGNLHRESGPAVIHRDGEVSFFQHYKRHRTNGPAFISAAGVKRYFVDGDELTPLEFFVRYGTM